MTFVEQRKGFLEFCSTPPMSFEYTSAQDGSTHRIFALRIRTKKGVNELMYVLHRIETLPSDWVSWPRPTDK